MVKGFKSPANDPPERETGVEAPPAEAQSPRVDHDLVRRAQKGDEAAFAALVERNQRRAWRVARNLVPRDEDADDILQEAFLRVFRSLERFDFKYAFTTWLFRIVTNLCIDHLRKRRPMGTGAAGEEDEIGFDPADDEIERPDETLMREERASLVRECIDSLAPHFRSVMVLRELDGLSCAEIATIVGATNVTVRWRLHRGRKLFQDEWERRYGKINLPDGFEIPANSDDESGVDPSDSTERGQTQ
jgi:RNA polymerase sigma-70 factor, ECF subfamily